MRLSRFTPAAITQSDSQARNHPTRLHVIGSAPFEIDKQFFEADTPFFVNSSVSRANQGVEVEYWLITDAFIRAGLGITRSPEEMSTKLESMRNVNTKVLFASSDLPEDQIRYALETMFIGYSTLVPMRWDDIRGLMRFNFGEKWVLRQVCNLNSAIKLSRFLGQGVTGPEFKPPADLRPSGGCQALLIADRMVREWGLADGLKWSGIEPSSKNGFQVGESIYQSGKRHHQCADRRVLRHLKKIYSSYS